MRICSISGVLLASAALPAQNWFHAPRLLDQQGEVLLAGDVDVDGDVDCVRFDGVATNWRSFTVLFNDGEGVFTAGNPVALPGNAAQQVLLADVDGDQLPDIVVSTPTSYPLGAGLLVHPGVVGGSFGAPIHVPLAGTVTYLRRGDANGDGIDDLAVVHYSPVANTSIARWIPGNGTRTFVPSSGFLLPVTYYVNDLALLDANGDGIDDFALLDQTGIQLLHTAGGAPTVLGAFLPSPYSFSGALVTPDLDHDGRRDLLVCASIFSGSVSLRFSGFRNLGNGTFAASSSQTFPTQVFYRPFTGDLDGDGIDDLLLRSLGSSSSQHYWLFRGDGLGSFAQRYSVSARTGSTWGVGLCDLDGDGHLDFVDARALFFGDGTLDPAIPTVAGMGVKMTDVDDDGDPDLRRKDFTLSVNDGRGVFASRTLALPAPGANLGFGAAVVMTDLDANGLCDYVVPLYRSVPNPPFQPITTFVEMRRLEETADRTGLVDLGAVLPGGVSMLAPCFADDADDDGDLDLINEQGLWLNNGAQVFAPPATAFGGCRPAAGGDLEGGGKDAARNDRIGVVDWVGLDLSLPMTGVGLAVLRHTSPTTYVKQTLAGPPGIDLTWFFALADLDQDGDLDIAADSVVSGLGSITILANRGGVLSVAASIPVDGQLGDLLAGDVDGDGLVDLAMSRSADTTLTVWRRNGPGFTYDPPVVFLAPPVSGLVDVDQDGDLDAVGAVVVSNRRFGLGAGLRRQYGTAAAGSGGRLPVLGAVGPIRAGFTPALRLRGALGGASGLLVVGGAEANLPSTVLPGLVLYASPVLATLGFVATGAPGVAGSGGFDLPVPVAPGFAGLQLFFQGVLFDPGSASGLAYSNGLEFAVGQEQ